LGKIVFEVEESSETVKVKHGTGTKDTKFQQHLLFQSNIFGIKNEGKKNPTYYPIKIRVILTSA
jgi:hypothetical protein